MSYLESNLAAFQKTYPLLHRALTKGDEKIAEYAVTDTRSGDPTIQLDGQYIHSRFDPRKESRRFIDSEISRDASVYISAGFGLGYHVEALYERTDNEIIIVVEPDVSLFLQAISLRDFSDLIHSGRVLFLIGTPAEDTILILEQHQGKLVQLIILRSLYNSGKEYYDSLEKTVKNYISRKEVNLSTLRRFGKLWIRNLSENSHLLSSSPGINSIKNKLEGLPALLIAAGPSLDRIIDELPELKKRFILVAVDTALRACLKKGVEPDFTVVVDPQYWNTRHLDRCHTEQTILISDTSTYPTVFRQIRGKTFLCSSSFPLGLYLEERTEIKGKLKAGGSVATAAWDFCRIMGARQIWCAGLDLGFPEKQTHCRGSFFEQRAHWLSARNIPAENLSWHALIDAGLHVVDANGGGRTWSDRRMSLYVRWFEEQMIKFPLIESRNLSRGGKKISGMPSGSLSDAMAMPVIRDDINRKLKEIKSVNSDPDLNGRLDTALSDLLTDLSDLRVLSQRGLSLSEELLKGFDKGEDLTEILSALTETDQKILNRSGKDIAGFILQDFISGMLKEKKSPDPSEIIKNSRVLYSQLKSSIDFQIVQIEKSLNKLKNIQV